MVRLDAEAGKFRDVYACFIYGRSSANSKPSCTTLPISYGVMRLWRGPPDA